MWNFIKSLISSSSSPYDSTSSSGASTDINPATGLPMVNGIGSVDVQGNPYGFNSSHDTHSHESDFNSHSGINTLSNDPFENPLAGHTDSFSSLGQDAFSGSSHDSFSDSHTSSFSDDSWNSSSSSFSDDSWSSSSSDFSSSSSWD